MAKGFSGSPNEARFFLDRLMRDGVVTPAHIERYGTQLVNEREGLLKRLAELGYPVGSGVAAGVVAGAAAAAVPAVATAARKAGRRAARKARPAAKAAAKAVAKAAPAVKKAAKKAVSPARAAIQKLQGRYLGLRQRIPADVVAKRFGKEAIAEKGKDVVVREMEKYVTDNNLAAPAKRSRPRARRGRK